ncbi:MAG: PIN domain-containing protein [Acidobacteria bacterium]|nr:PIN domain-containing protein [Acidobacteriota bacterium]
MIALDSSVLVAALCGWHTHHRESAAALANSPSGGFLVASHSILETFAVLTRLPPGQRLSPRSVVKLLEALQPRLTVVSPTFDPWVLLKQAISHGTTGGQTYDLLIATTVAQAGATTLLTWNIRHFRPLNVLGLSVQTPG